MYGFGMFLATNGIVASRSINPLWTGLLGYYTGDSTPNDALGSINGTLVNGATYATGKINNAFSLDGINDYVDLGNNYSFTGATAFSISLWYYVGTTSGANTLFGKQSISPPSYKGYQLQVLNGQPRFAMYADYNTSDYMVKRRSTILSINTWYHLTLTYDGSKNTSGVKLYINASDGTYDDNTNTFSGTLDTTGVIASIGSGNGSAYYANGKIDEVGIWNRELSASEVTELYNSGSGKQYPN